MKIPLPGINIELRYQRSKEVIDVNGDDYEMCNREEVVVVHSWLRRKKTTHIIHKIFTEKEGYYWDNLKINPDGSVESYTMKGRPPGVEEDDETPEEGFAT